eukprot:1582028-Rhodomonas_salina.3
MHHVPVVHSMRVGKDHTLLCQPEQRAVRGAADIPGALGGCPTYLEVRYRKYRPDRPRTGRNVGYVSTGRP